MTGCFSGTHTLGSFTLSSEPGVPLYLARLNAAGSYTLATAVPCDVLISLRALALAPNGTVVVGGGFIGPATFGSLPALTSFCGPPQPRHGHLTQTATAGGPVNDGVQALVVAPDNVVTIAGGLYPGCIFGSLPLLVDTGGIATARQPWCLRLPPPPAPCGCSMPWPGRAADHRARQRSSSGPRCEGDGDRYVPAGAVQRQHGAVGGGITAARPSNGASGCFHCGGSDFFLARVNSFHILNPAI